jgi:2-polyprenyl-3-methyl-5-hydroxy-6-metoxy-1,4-benzoquinol methylase
MIAADWRPEGLERVAACPVCDAAERRELHAGLTDRVFGTAPGVWTLWSCAGCRSAYLDPRPTPDTIARAYEGSYYTHADAPGPLGAAARARRALANGHLDARWGYDHLQPSASAGAWLGRLAPGRAAIADREIRHLPAAGRGRLLDVGCGNGLFLTTAASLGWDVQGVEPDPAAADVARRAGHAVVTGTIDDLDGGHFDAITTSHVIEHVHEPRRLVEQMAARVASGGRLWIATPNVDAAGHRRYGPDWQSLDPPRHLVLFTRTALEALVTGTGLVVEPPPVPAPDARLTFQASERIARHGSQSAPLALGARLATAFHAARCDRAARRDPGRAEELVIVARRP